VLERAKAVAEALVLGRVSRFALDAAKSLVELVELGTARDDGSRVDDSRPDVLGERGFSCRQVRTSCGELGLGAGEGLLGLVQGGQALLDVCEALLGRFGGTRGSSGEVGLHSQEDALARLQLSLALVQLLCIRGETGLRVVQRPLVYRSSAPGPTDTPHGVGELTLALLHRGDALGQLATKAAELLLGRDQDRVQALLLALDRERLGLLSTEQGHASMICAASRFSCLSLRGALEALFRAGTSNDLLALAEAETGLLRPKCLPKLLQARVEILDLPLYGRVQTLGQTLPELLALLRELFDLGM